MNEIIMAADAVRLVCAIIGVATLPELVRRVANSPLLHLRLLAFTLTVHVGAVIAHVIARAGDPPTVTLQFLVVGVVATAVTLVAWRKHDCELAKTVRRGTL